MSRPLTVIPSYRRSDTISVHTEEHPSTIVQLNKAEVPHYLLVQDQEFDAYWASTIDLKFTKVISLPKDKDNCGIAATRKYIVEELFLKGEGHDSVIQFDDDLEFTADAAVSVDWLATTAKNFNGIAWLPNAGIYFDVSIDNPNRLVIPTGRAMQAVAMNATTAKELTYTPDTLSEDFDVALQSHTKGWCNFGNLKLLIRSYVGNDGGVQATSGNVAWHQSNEDMSDLYGEFITYCMEWGTSKRQKLFIDWYSALFAEQSKADVRSQVDAVELATFEHFFTLTASGKYDLISERDLERFHLERL